MDEPEILLSRAGGGDEGKGSAHHEVRRGTGYPGHRQADRQGRRSAPAQAALRGAVDAGSAGAHGANHRRVNGTGAGFTTACRKTGASVLEFLSWRIIGPAHWEDETLRNTIR